jgi:hypothetical protein
VRGKIDPAIRREIWPPPPWQQKRDHPTQKKPAREAPGAPKSKGSPPTT